jgi:hypothetical protein
MGQKGVRREYWFGDFDKITYQSGIRSEEIARQTYVGQHDAFWGSPAQNLDRPLDNSGFAGYTVATVG